MKKHLEKSASRRLWISSCSAFKNNSLRLLLTIVLLLPAFTFVRAEISLSLEEAVKLAREHSFSLKQSTENRNAARYNYAISKSLRYPLLSMEAIAFYNNEVPTFEIPIFNYSPELGSKDNYQFDIKLTAPIYTGGKLSNNINVNREFAESAEFKLEAERNHTAYACRKAYLSMMLAQAVDSSVQASLTRIEVIRRNINNLFEAGLADSIDLFDAELAYQKALKVRIEQQTVLRNAGSVLANRLGISSDESIILTEAAEEPTGSGLLSTGKQPPLLRAELMMIDRQAQALEYFVRLKRAEYFPEIAAFLGYTYGMPNLDFINPGWNDNITTGLALKWDFNLGGKTGRSVQHAGAQAQAIRMAQKELEETLSLQLRIARENLELAYQSLAVSKRELEITREKFRLAGASREQGKLSLNRLLEMEAELSAAEKIYQASIINYYIAQTEQLYALGSSKIYGGL